MTGRKRLPTLRSSLGGYFAIIPIILIKRFFCASALSEVQFAKTMAWSAYNLGTTGYNQSVALGKVLKDHYGVNLRVLPAKNDVSRLLPLVKGRVQFSANGIATYFAQEGLYQFASETGDL